MATQEIMKVNYALPPLPEPTLEGHDYELWGQNVRGNFFTAEQMLSYARAARASLVAEIARMTAELARVNSLNDSLLDTLEVQQQARATAMVAPFDKGPWTVHEDGQFGAEVWSEDFEHDAKLQIRGDMLSETKLQYARWLAAVLNAAPVAQSQHLATVRAVCDVLKDPELLALAGAHQAQTKVEISADPELLCRATAAETEVALLRVALDQAQAAPAAAQPQPVAYRFRVPVPGGGSGWTFHRPQPELLLETQPLYAAPVAQPQPEPEWIVNDLGELGVKVGSRFFFLYKGESLEYGKYAEDRKDGIAMHEDGTPRMYRIVGKREFGETAHPIACLKAEGDAPIYDLTPARYTQELKYTPGLSFGKPGDGDWRPLPAAGAKATGGNHG